MLSAEADNTNRDLDYSGYRIIAAITVYFQTLKNVQLSDNSRNHALRAQPTDYSLICWYRLVNNL